MKPSPKGWPRITASLYYQDPLAAIDWLARAFDFTVNIKVLDDNGKLVHSELDYGDGRICVGGTEKTHRPNIDHLASPSQLGGKNTSALMIYVDDVDAHCKKARAAGGKIYVEPETNDYGPDYWTDRSYGVLDPGGHAWWIVQRLRGE